MTVSEIAKRAKGFDYHGFTDDQSGAHSGSGSARRVWRLIERVGYGPSNQARALVSRRKGIFGLMVSEIINLFSPR
jgi:hypothetical protein